MKTILLLSTVAITSLCGAAQAQIPLEMLHPRIPDQVQQQASAPLAQQPSASEPSESIDLGGLMLTLGMAQDDVLQHLGAKFKLTQASTNDPDLSSWTVSSQLGQPYKYIAVVEFIRGMLSSVNKYWTDVGEPDTEAGFAGALYRAVVVLMENNGGHCELESRSTQQPDLDTKTVFITCGAEKSDDQKYLAIDFAQLPDGRGIGDVREVLEYSEDEIAALKQTVQAGARATPSASPTKEPVPSLEEPNKEVEIATAREKPGNQSARPSPDAAETARREAAELANPSSLVTIRPSERLPDEELVRISVHNRALCDQIITVAGLTPRGLALYVPPEGQKFMAKNSQNYPRMCLLEDSNNVVPGVPRYLLVYAYSESAFAGFQPITRTSTTTTPVSGSGTVMNSYGSVWNFTFFGTVNTTEIDTMEAPYVIRSRSLYLNAYDVSGALVSRHSFTVSSQSGGNGASAIGYNGAQLIGLLWNNPSRLIKSVLKDVQSASLQRKTFSR